MLTPTDINELKKVFATKDELKENTDIIVKEIGKVIEMMSDFIEKTNKNEEEIRGQRVARLM